jgi:hypothetical protein
MTTITARIRSSRVHETRPLFVEKAATNQYSQNAAQPTTKTSSTVLRRARLGEPNECDGVVDAA